MATNIHNYYQKKSYALFSTTDTTAAQQNNTSAERISTPQIEQPQNKLSSEFLRLQEQQIFQNLHIRNIPAQKPTYTEDLQYNTNTSSISCNTASAINTSFDPLNANNLAIASTSSIPYGEGTYTVYYDINGELLFSEYRRSNGDIVQQWNSLGQCTYYKLPSAKDPTTELTYIRLNDKSITRAVHRNGEIEIFTDFFDASGKKIKHVYEDYSTGNILTTYYNETGDIIRWDNYEPNKTKTATLKIDNNLEIVFDLLTGNISLIKRAADKTGTYFSLGEMFSAKFTDENLITVLDKIIEFDGTLTTKNITLLITTALSYNEEILKDSTLLKKRIAILDSYINDPRFSIDKQQYQILTSIINEFVSPTPSYEHLIQDLRTLLSNQNNTGTEQVIALTAVIGKIMSSYYDNTSQTRGQFDNASGYFTNMLKGDLAGQCNDINPAIGRFIADVFDGVNGLQAQTASFQFMANHVESMVVINTPQENTCELLIQNYGDIIATGIDLKKTGYRGLQTGLSIMEAADKTKHSNSVSYGGSTQIRHAMYDRDGKMIGYVSSIDSTLEHAGLVYDLENRLRPEQEHTVQYVDEGNIITRDAQLQTVLSNGVIATGINTQASTNIYSRNDFIFDYLTANLDFDSSVTALFEEGIEFNNVALIAQGALQSIFAQKDLFSISAGLMLGTKVGAGNDIPYVADIMADTQFSGQIYIQKNISIYAGLSCTIWAPNVYNGIASSTSSVDVTNVDFLTNTWALLTAPKNTALIPTKFSFGTHWAVDDKSMLAIGVSLEGLRYSASLGLTTQIGTVDLSASVFGSYDNLQPLFGVTTYNGLHTLGLTIDMKF